MTRIYRRIATRAGLVASGLGLALAAGVGASALPQDLILTGARVVDVDRGEVLAGQVIVIRDGLISSVGPRGQIESGDAQRIDVGGRYVLPGLIDAHVHIATLDAARRALLSGVTTARSMGTSRFADVGLRELYRTGSIPGPEILAAGYHVRPSPAEGLFLDAPELGDLLETPVTSPGDLARVAQVMRSHAVDFIKVNATERAGLPETDPRKPFYDRAQLEALVDAARGTPVAAHAHGDEGGRAAVDAGVASIEHGTYLSAATLERMAELGTYLVPTIAVVSDLTLPGGDYDDPVLQIRGRHMLPQVRRTAAAAHAAGVPVVAATDTGYGPESVLRLSHELAELVAVGLSPAEALQAATIRAARLLGVSDRVGRLTSGYEADLVIVDRNPLEDIAALDDILFVATDGQVVLDRLAFSR